jgi:hypothetical protein
MVDVKEITLKQKKTQEQLPFAIDEIKRELPDSLYSGSYQWFIEDQSWLEDFV